MSAVIPPLLVTMNVMCVICNYVYVAVWISRQPVDSNTTRVKFTRVLAFCQRVAC